MVHSVLASLVHSLCTSAADPLSDLEGVRRAVTGECDLVVCLLTVSLTLHPTHTHAAMSVCRHISLFVTTCSEVVAAKGMVQPPPQSVFMSAVTFCTLLTLPNVPHPLSSTSWSSSHTML